MKKSKAETAETRKRIVEAAAQAFKNKGIRAPGVAEIMATAGLTHGGFYRHFESKEQLVAEACAASMDVLVESAEAAAAGGDESFLEHLQNYLFSCPLIMTGGELVRADMQTRRAASEGLRQLLDIIARRNRLKGSLSAQDDGIFTLSTMVGAVTLARILDDSELSARILTVARQPLASSVRRLPQARAE